MPPVGFELTISEGERPQTYSLDRTATGTGPTEHWYDVAKGQRPWFSENSGSDPISSLGEVVE